MPFGTRPYLAQFAQRSAHIKARSSPAPNYAAKCSGWKSENAKICKQQGNKKYIKINWQQ